MFALRSRLICVDVPSSTYLHKHIELDDVFTSGRACFQRLCLRWLYLFAHGLLETFALRVVRSTQPQ